VLFSLRSLIAVWTQKKPGGKSSVTTRPIKLPAIRKPERPLSRVFIHCSASDNPEHDSVAVMRRWHVNGNGWSDVGYHFFITKKGEIQTGRSIDKVPAAQAGNNTGTIAICLHGLKADKFTQEQFASLRAFCRALNALYDNQLTFHGHCEVAAKTCPVFDYKAALNLDDNGRMK